MGTKCLVCDENESKYKCPKCSIPYCSLVCYKKHKEECVPIEQQHVDYEKLGNKEDDDNNNNNNEQTDEAKYQKLINDKQIQYYLTFDALKAHLITLISIINDPAMSEEQTTEGRRAVALLKLNDLRKGGKQENEIIELFVNRVLELLES